LNQATKIEKVYFCTCFSFRNELLGLKQKNHFSPVSPLVGSCQNSINNSLKIWFKNAHMLERILSHGLGIKVGSQ
jgi:hypothetical protein